MQDLKVNWLGLHHGPTKPLALAALVWLGLAVPLFGATRSPKQRIVPNWARFEQAFVSTFEYTNALQEANFKAVFTSPLGETGTVDGFWDGGRIWRVRFCPNTPGQWTFTTVCSDARNYGLDGQTGKFLCTAPVGDSLFQRHGPVRVARDRRHFELADGTPFFWLGDTVWSGACLSTPKDWQRYATIRSSQDFNVAVWSVLPEESRDHESALTGFSDRIGVIPSFFQRLDAKIETLSREGILSAILPLSGSSSAINLKELPNEQATLLLRYVAARWGSEPVVWLMDVSDATPSAGIDRWRKIGNAVFTNSFHAPVVLLPVETPAVVDQFRDERWVDALGVDLLTATHDKKADESATRVADGAASGGPRPIILFAPCENGVAGHSQKRFNPDEVRRSVYQNLFMTPSAGVTYAAQGVVNWDTSVDLKTAAALGGGMPMWERALFMPAAKQMRPLAKLMNSIDFWRLRPQPEAVANQTPQSASESRVVAASTSSKDLTLVYLPQSNPVDVYLQAMPASPLISWLQPTQGFTRSAVAVVSGSTCQFPPPGSGDWVLLIKSGK
jgi:hypothetical protein